MRYLFTLLMVALWLQGVAQMSALTVYDIRQGNQGSSPCFFTIFKDELYFIANDETHGFELWKVGKTGGPKMVYDINPGTASGGYHKNGTTQINAMDRHMPVVKDGAGNDKMLYLQGNDGQTGWELFRYDGIASPALAYEFVPGSGSLQQTFLFHSAVAIGSNVYLTTFITTATTTTTVVLEYNAANNSARYIDSGFLEFKHLTAYNGNLFYAKRDTLYKYDVLNKAVTKVAYYSGKNSAIEHIEVIKGKLYFGLADGADGKLYEYDGIQLPRKIAGYCVNGSVNARMASWTIAAHEGKIYFPCTDNTGFCGPCEYDPATEKLKQLGGAGGAPDCFVSCNGKLFYTADDNEHGYELWSYDGLNPPQMEIDIESGKVWGNPLYLMAYNNELYFGAYQFDVSQELMKYAPSRWPAAVSNVFFTGEVMVYPNPATDACTIELKLKEKTTITAQLYDAMGKLVSAKASINYPAGSSAIQFDMKAFSAGVYYIKLVDDKGGLLYKAKVVKG